MNRIVGKDCLKYLELSDHLDTQQFDMTFLDPPFNQKKDYHDHDDDMDSEDYWQWMKKILIKLYDRTTPGGALYFMQREKNLAQVMQSLVTGGWTFQNIIIWKKMTSAVPGKYRYGKAYQPIVFATKGAKPRVFNRLRIDPPLPANYQYPRKNGMYVTDIWDDIRELTSGYLAGDEALYNSDNTRSHKQQSPLALVLRMVLTSTLPGDWVFDPFCGTGTTPTVAVQTNRQYVGVEKDLFFASMSVQRTRFPRRSDLVTRFYDKYSCTENLDEIWGPLYGSDG